METIINQITASQGLSAVAVLGLFNLLFIIIYVFWIGKAFDRINALNKRIDNSFDLIAENREQLILLKTSHSQLNQSIPKISKLLHEDFSHVLGERDKRVTEIEQELSKAIERGKITTEGIKQRFEQLEGVYQAVEGIVKAQKPASANQNIKIQKTDSIFLQKRMENLPKFKIDSKVKTNKKTFYGVVIERLVENNKYIYLVKNRATKQQRWFSESTLRNW